MVKRTVLGSLLGLALTLAQPAFGQPAIYRSDLCGGPRTTKALRLDDLGAGSTEAFHKRLWLPGSQPWPFLSPRRAIFLAYRDLVRSGILDARTVYIEWLDLRSTGYHDSRFYLASFRFDCGDRKFDRHALMLVLMDGTVILPGNADPSPSGGALLPRLRTSWVTFTDLYMGFAGVWARARHLVRDVRCSLSNCPELEGSLYYSDCKEEHGVQIDPATVASGDLWWWAEADWPRLSPGEAIRLASARLKPAVIDLRKDEVQIDVSWRQVKPGGWYYLIGFTTMSRSEACRPTNPASAFFTRAHLAVLMDGSVLVPWPEAKPNPHLRRAAL